MTPLVPRVADAIADGTGGLIAGAADDGNARGQPQFPPRRGGELPGHFIRLNADWQPGAIQVEFGKQRRTPAAMGDVEEQRAGGVAHFGCQFTRQTQPQIILGQQEVAQALVEVRLVAAEPKELGRGEAGEGGVADHLNERGSAAGAAFDLGAFGGGALVVPEQRGPQHLMGAIQEDRAMHLPAQPDAANLVAAQSRRGQGGLDAGDGAAPPILGLLLRPAGMRMGRRMLGGGRGQDGAVRPTDESLGATRAQIDAEVGAHGLLLRRETLRSIVAGGNMFMCTVSRPGCLLRRTSVAGALPPS
jgi:hypothetical protein